ncbi:MAG: HEAT repeat domain-containing protein [Pyrinomonadaceae bacterium]
MKNEKNLSKSIHKTLPALLILLVIYTTLMPEIVTASAKNLPASKIESANRDDFDKEFREGRDLIDAEEWARAADKFRAAIEKSPDNKSADAAFYWLAFCYKKQKLFKEADAALDRLLEKFPASSWASDARVMKMEIAAPLGRFFPGSVGTTTPIGGVLGLPATASPITALKGNAAATTSGFYESLTIGGVSNTAARMPLAREDEIKIAAFQSLLAADPKRAIETMGEILKPDSKASETLKQEVLRVLRSPRMSRNETFGYAASNSGIAKEFVPLLRETLIKSFQNETNRKIRKEIIYALANTGDQSIDYLKKLYATAENDREIKKAIISSFSSSANGFYGFATNVAQKRKIESDFLLEIVRTEKDLELRRLAFANLQRFQNWSEGEKTIDMLARLYDSEPDEAFKISLIRAFSGAKQNQAIQKLMDIAKNDKSDKLRLEAIYSLRTSKNPEVLKFLEDLIK